MAASGDGRPAASVASLAAALAALVLLVAGNQNAGANAQSAGASTPTSYGDVFMWASLTVDSQLRNQTKSIGDRVQFDCEITGYPTPRYTWYKDDVEIPLDEQGSGSQRFKVQPQDWGSRLRIGTLTAGDSGLYRCVATNPRGSVETVAFLRLRPVAAGGGPTSPSAASAVRQSTVGIEQILSPNIIDDERWLKFAANAQQQQLFGDDDDVNPYCQDYKGTYCNLLRNQQIYVTSRKSQHLADQRIMRMINDLGQAAISSKLCHTRVLEAVCYNQMPPCALDERRRPYPRRLCKSECEDIVAVCRNEFTGSPKAWRLLPNCAELSDLDGCIRMGTDGEQGGRDGTESVGAAGGKESHSGGDVPYVIIIPSAVGGLVIIVVVTVLCIRRRRSNRTRRGAGSRQRKAKSFEDDSDHSIIGKERDGKAHELLLLSRNGSSTGGSSSDRTPLPLSAAAAPAAATAASATTVNATSQVPYVKDVALSNIHFVEELGEGQFGKIYRAQVFGLYGSGTATTVLAKTLLAPPVAPAALALSFRREIDDMVELRHQHVALLLGVSLGGSPQCALYEHLPFGDLKQFLAARAPSPPPLPLSGGGGGSSVDSGQLYIGAAAAAGLQTPELLYVATQVASALEYLAGARRRHSDVAARNVLVGQNLSVKLSNLGVSRGPYAGDYCLLHDRLMPVRWLPPEAITYGQPSHEADVYSFGVLLWELFTFGQQPYGGSNNHEVMELVRSRHLLTCPPAAPTRIYSLMVECWHEAPAKRPSAHELHQRLRAWYLEAAAAPPIVSATDALGSGSGSGAGAAAAGRAYKSSSKSSSSAASSAGSSAGTPSAAPFGVYSLRGGGPNVVGPGGVVDPLASGGMTSGGSSSSGGGGCNGLDGSTVPLLQQGQRLLPPSSPSYVANGSAVVPSYYAQQPPLPYVACTTPTSLSAPSSAGGGFDIKPATPVDRGGGSSAVIAAAAPSASAPFPDDLAQQSYVETQVDFPHRRVMTGNDYV